MILKKKTLKAILNAEEVRITILFSTMNSADGLGRTACSSINYFSHSSVGGCLEGELWVLF